MAKVSLQTIKNWFKTGLKPTQAQFWDTWDSFRHKDENIPNADIEGLASLLNEKASAEALSNHLSDANAHGGLGGVAGNFITKIASTDHAIVRFDGLTGEVQNTNATIDDTGNMTLNGITIGRDKLTNSYNLVFGEEALANNVGNMFNTAIGDYALRYLEEGNYNVALGSYSMGFLIAGSNNVALGFQAGSSLTGFDSDIVDNINSNRSIFIGAYTHARGENESNQIVIGNEAFGHGSNTVTLGDNNILKTILKGNLGVNAYNITDYVTIEPVTPLDVNGRGWFRASVIGALPASAGAGLKVEYSSVLDVGLIQAYSYSPLGARHLALQTEGGNLAVGTAYPTEKLDVAGKIKATSLILGDWELIPNGTNLEFRYGAGSTTKVVKGRLTSEGVLEAVNHKLGLT